MKTKKLYIALSMLAATVGFSSCDSYLDKLPDNRMELSTPEDVSKLLVSAYSEIHPVYILEMYSDNTDEYDNTAWTAESRMQDQAYAWKDITDPGSSNESVVNIWDGYYSAIRTCNEAIAYIKKLSPAEQDDYKAQLGEALVARAYAEFMLSTVFCRAYNPETAATDLGLPYPTEPNYSLVVNYERGTLAELYAKIDADLKEGLPLLTNTYDHPKFHFTPAAANAFAARFYLYYQKPELAIAHANAVLGTEPASKLRNWTAWNQLSANDQIQPNAYVNSSNPANLLLQVVYSGWGYYGGPTLLGKKYAHGRLISQTETLQAQGPWGKTADVCGYTVFYNDALSNYFLRKNPGILQYTDEQQTTGFIQSEMSCFNTDETLMVRAEAYAMQKDYVNALKDINAELSAFAPGAKPLTLETIKDFYDNLDYYTPENPTPKKELHPSFTLDMENQEPMLQCILQLRRLLTIHEGLRMQDIKRYGITIYRRRLTEGNVIERVTDTMDKDDPRLSIQLPSEVLSAGMQANPRNTTNK